MKVVESEEKKHAPSRPVSELEQHMQEYLRNRKVLDEKSRDVTSIRHAKKRLKNKIICHKYNYAMDEVVQNFCYYPGHLQLSEDETELELWLKKPLERTSSSAMKD